MKFHYKTCNSYFPNCYYIAFLRQLCKNSCNYEFNGTNFMKSEMNLEFYF